MRMRWRGPQALLKVLFPSLAMLLTPSIARAGLVGYWKLDETTGQVAHDQTGVNDGQLGSTPGPDANDPTVNQPGRVGAAYSFDGSDDYVVVPDHPSIGAGVTNTLSLSVWLNPAVNLDSSNHRILEKGDAYFLLEDLATGGMNFLIKQSNNNKVVGLKEPLSAGNWHHIAATFDASTGAMKIYLDGGHKNTTTTTAAPIDDDHLPLRLGSDDSGRYFPGRLDEVAIFDHVLSPYQIVYLAQGGSAATLPATPPPLITSVDRTGSGLDPVAPRVVNGGFAENALAFVDRSHEWNNLPAAHPEMVGGDYVKIANDDRSATPFRLNVGLAQPATVYLLVDDRVNQAAMRRWMAAYGFQDTGADIGVDESGDGDVDRISSVYWGNFPAGSVDIFQQGQGGTNMYGVVAVPGQLAPSAHSYTPLGTGKTFLEQGGRVVIEAENFTSRTSNPGETAWTIKPAENNGTSPQDGGPMIANYRGSGYLQTLPDEDPAGGGGPLDDPTATYQVQITTPGTYRIYLRWDGNNTNDATRGRSDSVFVDIVELKDGSGGTIADWYELTNPVDGDFANPAWDGGGGFEQNQATASDNPITWNFAVPGIYTIRLTQREDGAAVDAIVLQLTTLGAPGDPGPDPSDFSDGTPLLTGYSKLGGDYDATHPLGVASGLVEGAPAFVDAPGTWTNIPPALLGADYIRTENDDAGYGFADYSLIAGQDAVLYVFLDDRYVATHGIPQWMADMGFVDTGLDVLLASSLPFSVFQSMEKMVASQPTSLYGLGYDLQPAYNFYGIAVSDVMLVPEPCTTGILALGGLIGLLRRTREGARGA